MTPDAGELVQAMRDELEKRLQLKTGWGRVEVLVAFDAAALAVLGRVLRAMGGNRDGGRDSRMFPDLEGK